MNYLGWTVITCAPFMRATRYQWTPECLKADAQQATGASRALRPLHQKISCWLHSQTELPHPPLSSPSISILQYFGVMLAFFLEWLISLHRRVAITGVWVGVNAHWLSFFHFWKRRHMQSPCQWCYGVFSGPHWMWQQFHVSHRAPRQPQICGS